MFKNIFRSSALMLCTFVLYSCETLNESEKSSDMANLATAQADTSRTIVETKPKDTVILLKEDVNLTRFAYLAAGLRDKIVDSIDTNNSEQEEHFSSFELNWSKLENKHLSKLRAWRKENVTPKMPATYNIFYPFSGPDILNAVEIFPDAENYIMFGLEPIANLPKLDSLPKKYLADLQIALAKTFALNYFITSNMNEKLKGKGVTPILLIFLARTGHKIVNVERFAIEKEGKIKPFANEELKQYANFVKGIHISFFHPDKNKLQHLYFVSTNLADAALKGKPEVFAYARSFPNKTTLTKSASYLLHNGGFTMMRDYILDDTERVLQDDTGIPYIHYIKHAWQVKLYGNYAKPVKSFENNTNYYQKELLAAYQTDSTRQKIEFSFGYHSNSAATSVIWAEKK